jgi:hypothetical protein
MTFFVIGTSTYGALLEAEQPWLEDVFANLILNQALYTFPTLVEEEMWVMKVILGGRSNSGLMA